MVRIAGIGSCASSLRSAARRLAAPCSGRSCPNDQRRAVRHALPVRVVGVGRRIVVERRAHLGHDADERLDLVVFTHEQPAHGLGISGQRSLAAFSERTATPWLPVAFVERAAVKERDVHRSEISGARVAIVDGVPAVARRAFEVDRVVPGLAARGQRGDDARGLNAGEGVDRREKPIEELCPGGRVRVAAAR